MKLFLPSTSVALFALAACTTPAPVALKEGDVPGAFTAPIAKDAPVWPQADWWTALNAPELPPLETTAKEQNLDLLAAAARVLQAQAQTGIAGSALFPNIDATGTAQRRGTDQKGVPGGNTQNTFGVSAQASYEVGPEFPAPFLAESPGNTDFFVPSPRKGHFLFDLGGYLERKLRGLGLGTVERAPHDTAADEARFFSWRRTWLRGEKDYGRELSAIALVP